MTTNKIDCEHLSLTANKCPCPVNCHCQPCALKKVKCLMCQYEGGADTYLPNLTSSHNACRCPKCGSTSNRFNVEHSRWWSEQQKERKEKKEQRERELQSLCSAYGRERTSPKCSDEELAKLENAIFQTSMKAVMGEDVFSHFNTIRMQQVQAG